MRPRVPLVKIVASALTIGSGGSGGREGPIAQIGAGFGSALADLFRLRPSDRRVLLAAGMGDFGIAADLSTPLRWPAALFAAEVLYWSPEFEADVILPAAIASVIAYCTYGSVFGWTPLFAIPSVQFDDPLQLVPYVALAICMAILASIYTRTFYGITRLFHWLPIPRFVKPAIGALLAGSVGVGLYLLLDRNEQSLAVLSFGYGAIQAALTDHQSLGAELLLAIALGKILTTSLTIGSGGSGGVFGPSMVIGGCGGGALGIAMAQFWPHLVHPVSFVIVGMAGFFAAAAKTPFSTLIIVSEMTGGYQLLLPALWVCTISFMLSDEQSIYSAQVEGRAQSPAHQGRFVRDALSGAFVSQCIDVSTGLSLLKAQDPLPRVLDLFNSAADSVFPVVDDQQKLLRRRHLSRRHVPGFSHAGSETPGAGSRHDAHRRHSADARRYPGTGLRNVRRQRSARSADRQQSARQSRPGHGPPVGYQQRVLARVARLEGRCCRDHCGRAGHLILPLARGASRARPSFCRGTIVFVQGEG